MRTLAISLAILILVTSVTAPAFSQAKGSRSTYVYDRAGIISPEYESSIDNYLRKIDDSTSAEIIIYTIPSFLGHGIKKDGQELNDRDTLANYLFNEVPLDGTTGIGKKGKDNGVLILFSLERDAASGSMRIEVGKGLEGDITDGTAGAILDSYLVPARDSYETSGNANVFDQAFLDTVIALGNRIGYTSDDPQYQQSRPPQDEIDYEQIALILMFIAFPLAFSILNRRRRRSGGFFAGGYGGYGRGGGGGFGGGGGRSGGGGAGR
ncbi:TPM domain-containing protein [Candidatus Nitrosotenuis chungbukensis]|uniref:TPM domain-containing protein n=1 Tax=Candidatus Nitrosotenuis chungbukensis TaxID=1353246 RepID=UPI000694B602|nr:TPM domain-containing protein [Candidatus Nitrosotenuis chungbukensis]